MKALKAHFLMFILIFQRIESDDLEEETQKADPVKYHEAHQALCSVE